MHVLARLQPYISWVSCMLFIRNQNGWSCMWESLSQLQAWQGDTPDPTLVDLEECMLLVYHFHLYPPSCVKIVQQWFQETAWIRIEALIVPPQQHPSQLEAMILRLNTILLDWFQGFGIRHASEKNRFYSERCVSLAYAYLHLVGSANDHTNTDVWWRSCCKIAYIKISGRRLQARH